MTGERGMSPKESTLTDLSSHFAFGSNWAKFAEGVTEAAIDEAVAGLHRLLGGRSLTGLRFLDIGCGSGIHSLAATRLGARQVVATDLDPKCAETTRQMLREFSPNASHEVHATSVFELDPRTLGSFDVVYSWGVLHHTGAMHRALKLATDLVAKDGDFLFALYRRTWLCSFWKNEKKWYAGASPRTQAMARACYSGALAMGLWARGRSYRRYLQEYERHRGMSYFHDVHDWLGGYPYESISPSEVDRVMTESGFIRRASFLRNSFVARIGLLGSGCDEYAYHRAQASSVKEG